jgi:hypothetical protein
MVCLRCLLLIRLDFTHLGVLIGLLHITLFKIKEKMIKKSAYNEPIKIKDALKRANQKHGSLI